MFLSDIINIIDKEIYVKDRKIKQIKIDTRDLNKGDLFICINKGHLYIKDAINKKVSAIIVSEEVNIDTNIPIIRVDDTIKVLGSIASYLRKKYQGKVIAITGSNGKSTTKEILSHVLSKKYKVLSNFGNENNHIGVPKTLLNINDSYDYIVLELGTNHLGEIKYLTDIVKPDIALITNIGNSHIGHFGNKKNILKEKLSIKGNNTILFVNGNDKLLNKIDAVKAYTKDYNFDNYPENYALVSKVCEYLGFTKEEINKYLSDFTYLPSRMNYYSINGITIIDDAYNASFESVLYGINKLKEYNRKIIVLGDMLELGKYSSKLHRKIFREIKKLKNVILITIGEETSKIKNKLHFQSLEDIVLYFQDFKFNEGDVIYLKGAHKMHLSCLVEPLIKFANN